MPHAAALLLNQRQYIINLLEKAEMINVKPVLTPIFTTSKLGKHGCTLSTDPTKYRQVVGALQYLTLTWPDITFDVNKVSQFMHP